MCWIGLHWNAQANMIEELVSCRPERGIPNTNAGGATAQLQSASAHLLEPLQICKKLITPLLVKWLLRLCMLGGQLE